MRASVTIHVETLWTNRAELMIEAELDNPHSETNQQVVSMMFDTARLMAAEKRSALLVSTAEGLGIVTDLDLRDKVVGDGLSREAPVSACSLSRRILPNRLFPLEGLIALSTSPCPTASTPTFVEFSS